MKNSIKVFVLFAISLAFVFISCTKDNASSKDDTDMIKSSVNEGSDIDLKGDFEKIVTNPLIKIDDCKFIVQGTIEFRKDGKVVAVIDYGDGICDDMATKTVDGKTVEFSLKKYGDKEKYYKVVAEPIVKIEGCNHIVSGIIEFYNKKDDTWLASIDFGDGTCDELATKTWEGGSEEFSMKKW